jgi:hypothetical protein
VRRVLSVLRPWRAVAEPMSKHVLTEEQRHASACVILPASDQLCRSRERGEAMRCPEDDSAKGIMSAVGALPTWWPSTMTLT